MIQVKASSDGGRYRFRMEGHAEYNPGNDIVCAGASAIAYSLLGYLHNAPEHIEVVEELIEESGLVSIRLQGDETLSHAFDMAVIGLMQIAVKYPENISVKIFLNP